MVKSPRMASKFLLRCLVTSFLVLLALLPGLASRVLADGIIIPDPLPEPLPLRDSWLAIRYHRVDVTIEEQIARTHVEQEFVNEHEWECEGTYIFPLPEGAAVSEFVMWIDGERVEGKILTAEEARRVYEDIVRRRRDPALLEYVGRNAVQARIFPVPPGGSRRIELEYTQVLSVENGLVHYIYPLSTEKFSARELEEVRIHVEVRSREALRAIYSPSHQDRVYIERDGEYRAIAGYEEYNVLPKRDFELIYTVSHEDVGLNLLTRREPPEDGFFLLLIAPTIEVPEDQVVPRDIILVLDVSGSMEGEKLAQAKDALGYVLEHLNEEDRFNIIAFSTGLQQYAQQLRPASERRQALAWIERLEALGGTDINRALLEALTYAGERPTVLIFLTDGLPTEGVTDVEQIISNVKTAAPGNLRLFPLGVGDDVNTVLLDTLAEQHGGAPGYIRPGERIDEAVSAFYARISLPVLTNIALDFGDVLVEDIYPPALPDLFAGTQLILVGRYRDAGATRIVLTGEVEGERREFVYEGNFRANGGNEFIPRLWAMRKIGYLLTQIRLYGERREWVDAVVALSVRYGIITPYTSFLVEEEDILTPGGQERAAEKLFDMPLYDTGAPAVEMAQEQTGLRNGEVAVEPPTALAPRMQVVGSRTFILRDGIWTDTAFDPFLMTTRKIGFGSKTYFDLLSARPEWGQYLALGSRVIFVADGMAYEVVEGEGEEVTLPTPTSTPNRVEQITETPTPEPVTAQPSHRPPSADGVCSGAVAIATVAFALCLLGSAGHVRTALWDARPARNSRSTARRARL